MKCQGKKKSREEASSTQSEHTTKKKNQNPPDTEIKSTFNFSVSRRLLLLFASFREKYFKSFSWVIRTQEIIIADLLLVFIAKTTILTFAPNYKLLVVVALLNVKNKSRTLRKAVTMNPCQSNWWRSWDWSSSL